MGTVPQGLSAPVCCGARSRPLREDQEQTSQRATDSGEHAAVTGPVDRSWEQSAASWKEQFKPLGSVQVWGCFGNNGVAGRTGAQPCVRTRQLDPSTVPLRPRTHPAALVLQQKPGPGGHVTKQEEQRKGEQSGGSKRPRRPVRRRQEEKGQDSDRRPGGLWALLNVSQQVDAFISKVNVCVCISKLSERCRFFPQFFKRFSDVK